jgi:hypothetical protein
MKPNRPLLSLTSRRPREPAATPIPAMLRRRARPPPARPRQPLHGRDEAERDQRRGREVEHEQRADRRNLRVVVDGVLLEVLEADAEQGDRPRYRVHVATVWLALASEVDRPLAVVDLVAARREDVPLGAELVRGLPLTSPRLASPA